MTRPYLALFRAGPSSLHPHAVERLAEQNFDYALSWFGDTPPEAPDAVFVHAQKGAKWPGLERTLAVYADVVAQYRHVWLPDDDLLCVPEDVSRMFLVCDELGLELAQPALTVDSYWSHVSTLQHQAFQVRFTNFVEIMAPVLSAEMLARVTPTLPGKVSGYGLDNIWPRMSTLGKVGIIDATPVKHTRPVGGPNYQFNQAAGISPMQELWLQSARHFIETATDRHLTYGGLLQDGRAICLGATEPEIESMLTELLASLAGLPVSATQTTRYLADHLAFAQGTDPGTARYPRGMLRVALNQALRGTGIEFAAPAVVAAAATKESRPVAAPVAAVEVARAA
jgi:hypothetical protein